MNEASADDRLREDSSLADEIAAEIALGLAQTAQRAAIRLRELDDVATRLTREGLAQPLPVDPFDSSTLEMIGLATACTTIPAFGGLLFGVSGLGHGLRMRQADVLDAWQVSRVKVGDTDHFGRDEKLRWQQILLAYDILEALFQEGHPTTILLDLPLFISRREQATILDDGMLAAEWEQLESTVNRFWQDHLTAIYPFNPNGFRIISLRSHPASSLFAALLSNPQTSPDPAGRNLAQLVSRDWSLLCQLGQSRLLERILGTASRSIAYSYEDLNLDPRWQPKELHHVGVLGFFLRARSRTSIWHVQVPGHRTQWSGEDLDRLGVNLVRATLYDDESALPLPLWYARQFVRVPKDLLIAYRQRIEEELHSREGR